MEETYLYYKQIRQWILDETKQYSHHLLMKKIDDWERQSILQIQQTANDIRNEFQHTFTKHTLEINERLREISEQLNQIEINENEIIKSYLEKLHELKTDFATPKTINIHYDDHPQSFIKKIKLIHVSIDSFHQPIGDIQTINYARTIIHGPSSADATIRGKKEFFFGKHQFRFQIERLGLPKWIFFGIISKDAPLEINLHQSPSVYGWAGHHQVWLNGIHHHRYNGYQSELNINHIFELSLDCDRQKICLFNETTSTKHELEVSIIKCPFPWIIYIGLYGANDQIQLLLA